MGMLITYSAVLFSCLSLGTSAVALDLSLPKDATEPLPIYIVANDLPGTSMAVKSYAREILSRINAQSSKTPLLDEHGQHLCADQTIELLVVIDKSGQLNEVQVVGLSDQTPSYTAGKVDRSGRIQAVLQHNRLPSPGMGKAVHDHLTRAIRSISPLPPFPEPELLNSRLVGIPLTLPLHCKPHWVDIPPLPGRR